MNSYGFRKDIVFQWLQMVKSRMLLAE